MHRWFPLLSLAIAASSPAFAAESDEEPTDAPAGVKDTKGGVVREIKRGFYLQANFGSTIYVGARRQLLRPGTTLDLHLGYDVVDKEKASVSVEGTVTQAFHNGMSYDQQGAAGLGANQLIEGDIYTIGGTVGVEGSYYPVRRVGIGGHLGGGVLAVPLLMNREAYDTEVVGLGPGDGAWGGPQNTPSVHQGVKPLIYVGPTIEYYTKLSHFSLGLDADFIYAIGLDAGVKITGYMKYSF